MYQKKKNVFTIVSLLLVTVLLISGLISPLGTVNAEKTNENESVNLMALQGVILTSEDVQKREGDFSLKYIIDGIKDNPSYSWEAASSVQTDPSAEPTNYVTKPKLHIIFPNQMIVNGITLWGHSQQYNGKRIVEFEILYLDANGEWKNALNKEGGTAFTTQTITAEDYNDYFQFQTQYETEELKLVINKSYEAWQGACQIQELEVWGRNLDPAVNLSSEAFTSIENGVQTSNEPIQNAIDGNVTSYASLSDSQGEQMIERVYENGNEPRIYLDLPVDATIRQIYWYSNKDWDGATVTEAKLEYLKEDGTYEEINVSPQEIVQSGEIRLKRYILNEPIVTSRVRATLIKSNASYWKSGMIAELMLLGEWKAELPQKAKDQWNTDDTLMTNVPSEDSLDLLSDGAYTDTWTGTAYNRRNLTIRVEGLKTIEKITFYSPTKQINTNIDICLPKTINDVFETLGQFKLNWVKDNENSGYKAEVNIGEIYPDLISDRVNIMFTRYQELTLSEIVWNGKEIGENLFRKADLVSNGEPMKWEDKVILTDGYVPSYAQYDFSDGKIKASFPEYYTVEPDKLYYVQRNSSGFYKLHEGGFKWENDEITVINPNSNLEVSEIILEGNISGEEPAPVPETTEVVVNEDGTITSTYAADTTSFIKNPATGGVIYVEDPYANPWSPDGLRLAQNMKIDEYWDKMDKLISEGLKPSILYMRLGWSYFEPEEGKYAWEDPESEIYKLIEGARERGLQLAFRVLLDSQSSSQESVPSWLYEKGLTWSKQRTIWNVEENEWQPVRNAHVNSPILLTAFDKFLEAMAEEFDNDGTAYLDAQGVGCWGELHDLDYDSSICSEEQAVQNIMNLYKKHFKNTLLGAQYGGTGWYYGVQQGFIMRRDGLGSPRYYPDGEKQALLSIFNNNKIPLYAESCFHGLRVRQGDAEMRWAPDNWIVGWSLERLQKHLLNEIISTRANTLDLHMPSDSEVWLNDYPEGQQIFIENGGYRFAPSYFTVPQEVNTGDNVTFDFAFKNLNAGRMPTYNLNWENKYRLAFGLMDESGEIHGVKAFDYSEINPGDWLKENGDNQYSKEYVIPDDLYSGTYKIVTGFIDKDGQAKINLAVQDMEATNGWYTLAEIVVHGEENPDQYSITVKNGNADKIVAKKGETVTVTADTAPEDKVFDKWTSTDGVAFADENAVSTTFVMPEKDVTVTAVYKDKPIDYITLTDTKTGISVGGKISEGATLRVVSKEAEDYADMQDAFAGHAVIGTYEIFIENGSYTGPLALNFPVDQSHTGSTVFVKQRLENGQLVTYEAVSKDGKIQVTVQELSQFMLGIEKQETKHDSSVEKEETVQSAAPKTGDDTSVVFLIGMIFIAITTIAGVIIRYGKRYQKK